MVRPIVAALLHRRLTAVKLLSTNLTNSIRFTDTKNTHRRNFSRFNILNQRYQTNNMGRGTTCLRNKPRHIRRLALRRNRYNSIVKLTNRLSIQITTSRTHNQAKDIRRGPLRQLTVPPNLHITTVNNSRFNTRTRTLRIFLSPCRTLNFRVRHGRNNRPELSFRSVTNLTTKYTTNIRRPLTQHRIRRLNNRLHHFILCTSPAFTRTQRTTRVAQNLRSSAILTRNTELNNSPNLTRRLRMNVTIIVTTVSPRGRQ